MSHSFIEKNIIKDNIKANIAVGGLSNKETIILKNTISNGRCEGIFFLENLMARVFLNDI